MAMNDEDLKTGRWVDERFATLNPDEAWRADEHRGLVLLRGGHERAIRGKRSWAKRTGAWIAVGGFAMCVSLMATPVTHAFAQRCVSACVSQTYWITGLIGRAHGSGSVTYIKPGARKPAPNFTLNDASGNPLTLGDYRGKVVLLNFWATWCAPCKAEIPWFGSFQSAFGGRGFSVIGVSMDDDGWASVRPYIEARGVNYPVVVGNDEVARRFDGVHSLPTTVIIDRAGRIAAVHIGICKKSEYEEDVETILNE